MANDRKYIILIGTDELLQDKLNNWNRDHNINIIQFTPVDRLISKIILHRRKKVSSLATTINIERIIENLDFATYKDMLCLVINNIGNNCIIYNINRDYKTTVLTQDLIIIPIDEACEMLETV